MISLLYQLERPILIENENGHPGEFFLLPFSLTTGCVQFSTVSRFIGANSQNGFLELTRLFSFWQAASRSGIHSI